MKLLLWHRKNKINKRGEAPIYCRITINGIRGTDFTTNVFCPVGMFDTIRQVVPGCELCNMQLEQLKHRITSVFLELQNKGEPIEPNTLRDFVLGKRSINMTMVDLMREYIVHRDKLVSIGEISEGTYHKTRDALKNLGAFLTQKQLRLIALNMFSPKLATEFYYWLQEHKGTGPEYASKTIQIIKAMINFAILNDYIKFNSLTSIRFKRGPRKKIEYLQPEEVKQISSHKFASSRLQQVADLFVLQCYTGFSYADLASFYPGHLESDENGREWIVKPRAKNNQESVLPFLPEARQIAFKYFFPSLQIYPKKLPVTFHRLPFISNQKYNVYLKEVGEIVGIKIKLTTHIGRKTFGTIALNKGYSIESVSKMLGHTNIKTTQGHYAVILKKRIVGEEM